MKEEGRALNENMGFAKHGLVKDGDKMKYWSCNETFLLWVFES